MADPRIDQARHERNIEKAKRREVESERDRFKKERDHLLFGMADCIEVKKQRDQLLEGIEAHSSRVVQKPCGTDLRLYALADRVRSKGGDAVATARWDGPKKEQSTVATRGDSDQVDGVAPDPTSELLKAIEAIWPVLRNPKHPDHEPAPHAGRKLRVAAEKARASLSSDEGGR